MSDKISKTRVSVTLTRIYVDSMDQLVEAGVFLDRRELVTDGLRRVFRSFKMPPFAAKEPAKPEE